MIEISKYSWNHKVQLRYNTISLSGHEQVLNSLELNYATDISNKQVDL